MFFKSRKKKLAEECWNVDYNFIVWLNQHLKVYLQDAPKVVNLEYHKFEYQGQEYTQKQLIERMIELSDNLIEDGHYFDWEEQYSSMTNELLDIFKLCFQTLWW